MHAMQRIPQLPTGRHDCAYGIDNSLLLYSGLAMRRRKSSEVLWWMCETAG